MNLHLGRTVHCSMRRSAGVAAIGLAMLFPREVRAQAIAPVTAPPAAEPAPAPPDLTEPPAPFADPRTTGQVMKFRVVPLRSHDTSHPPHRLDLPGYKRLGSTASAR